MEFGLAAQADTKRDAILKLEEQLRAYVLEAVTVHRDFAPQLLSRRAPMSLYVRYYAIRVVQKLHSAIESNRAMAFWEAMPLAPAACA